MKTNFSVDTVSLNLPMRMNVKILLGLGFKRYLVKGKDGFFVLYFLRARNINYQYYVKYSTMKVTVSIPKLLSGSNALSFDFNKTDDFIKKMNKEAKQVFRGRYHCDFRNANISEIHVFRDFYFNSEEEMDEYFNSFIKIGKGKRLKRRIYPTSVVYSNKSTRITIYKKVIEMQARKKFNKLTIKDAEVLDEIMNNGMHILRVEIKNKRDAIKYFANKKVRCNRNIGNILNREFCKKIFNFNLEKINLNYRVAHKDYVLKKINESSKITQGTKNQLIEFLKIYNSMEKIEKHYKSYKVNNFKKMINKLGFSATYLLNPLKEEVWIMAQIIKEDKAAIYSVFLKKVYLIQHCLRLKRCSIVPGSDFGIPAKAYFDTS